MNLERKIDPPKNVSVHCFADFFSTDQPTERPIQRFPDLYMAYKAVLVGQNISRHSQFHCCYKLTAVYTNPI